MAWPSTDVTSFAAIQLQYGRASGDPVCRNTFHVWGHDDSDGIGHDAAALRDVLNSTWISELVTAVGESIPSEYAFTGVLARGISDPNDETYVPAEAFVSFDHEGTLGGADGPAGMQCLLHIGTDVARKGASGRLWIPACSSEVVTNDGAFDVGSSYFANVRDIATKIRTLCYTEGASHAGEEMADLDLVVWSLARMKRGDEPWAARAVDVRAQTRVHWLNSRTPHG
jgi:hypothetical protein